MAIVVGIDEAGLGPLLGPLVVSAVSLEVPDELLGGCLWEALAPAVSRSPRHGGRAVAIADSKRLYHGLRGAGGLEHLERGVLAALGAGGWAPATLRGLLGLFAQGAPGVMDGYPWYSGADVEIPCCTGIGEGANDTSRLGRRLARVGIRVRDVYVEPVFEHEFNALIAEHDTKSELLFSVNARLLRRLTEDAPAGTVVVHADRHGGRKHYLPGLRAIFADRWIWVLGESELASSYRIDEGARTLDVHFTVRCEGAHLEVALASMVSKYVRELCMKLVNRFWLQHVPALAPTAGYHGDGTRFLEEILPAARALGMDEARLRRWR